VVSCGNASWSNAALGMDMDGIQESSDGLHGCDSLMRPTHEVLQSVVKTATSVMHAFGASLEMERTEGLFGGWGSALWA
jgi:hypothetical protein